MQWLYRLQRHIAITQSECTVILALAFLFGVGLVIRYVQGQSEPLAVVDYTEEERSFEAASEAPVPEEGEQALSDSLLAAMPARAPERAPYAAKVAPPAGSINLNTAGVSELQRLPRIGPKMAARIIAYREAHGSFRRVQDLVRVRGIGTKTLERLMPYLTVDGAFQ